MQDQGAGCKVTPSFSHEAPQESNGRRAEASIQRFLVPVDRSHDMGGVESDAAEGMDSLSLSVAFVGFPDSDGESKADSEADSEADSDENSDESSKADRADLGTLHPGCPIFIQGASRTGHQP